ncbi:protein of unknown function [Duganella sp. CF402]|jgi:hypothetical protein|uniref:cyanophycin metabolism-associated DUF1854 family protein n=1 Tax=unclassified Duganella TaxID=2636909 RepID=UPI0008CF3910|nr:MULTISPECIES: DUF1854 domain-containing protein [unclassified Duganella]RZT09307.1 uncharacterized protein DUF1854 [Duganella sp. BK701]SEL62387.1 protein of unknown function [Duganella sp. CF402]
MTTQFELTRNPFGKLVLTTTEGVVHEGVSPVRAFPVQAPEDGISLLNSDGKEVAWIDRIGDLPAAVGALVSEELSGREFMPEIARINSVTSYATPCTWSVKTDRGDTEFVLRGEEDIRRLTIDTLLITDIHGIHYLIRDLRELDKHSKKIIDRFL